LLVEDMLPVGWAVQGLAKHAGYKLEWSTTAEEGWDYLQDHRPELVLLDINLPGMNGIELIRRIRAEPKLAGLTIAVFSQGEHPETVADAQTAGANYILSKDLLANPSVWQRRLDEILPGADEAA
jgi:DNA-binding response OmpR family regulator